MKDNMRTQLLRLNDANKGYLEKVYKDVFSGHPWHEDLICANAKRENGDRCMVQYTSQRCERFDVHKRKAAVENDCRNNYKSRVDIEARKGVVLLPEDGNLERCIGCGEELRVVQFYPDFVDHSELIRESIEKGGFIGYLARVGEEIAGFSWGYTLPMTSTKSVKFEKITPVLKLKGINPDRTFYGSEVGVVNKFQGAGIGSAVSAIRIEEAEKAGFEFFVTRTVNPYVHSILERLFSGKEGEILLDDPERSSRWFRWKFDDLDQGAVKNAIDKLK